MPSWQIANAGVLKRLCSPTASSSSVSKWQCMKYVLPKPCQSDHVFELMGAPYRDISSGWSTWAIVRPWKGIRHGFSSNLIRTRVSAHIQLQARTFRPWASRKWQSLCRDPPCTHSPWHRIAKPLPDEASFMLSVIMTIANVFNFAPDSL